MPELVLTGPANSTFVCAARLALDEKGVAYRLAQPDVLKSGGFRLGDMLHYLVAQQPRLDHGRFALFEAESILRYVDAGFEGPALQPADARSCALMVEIVSVIRDHLHPTAIGAVVAQRLFTPFLGGVTDYGAIADALPALGDALLVVEQLSFAAHDGEKSELLVGPGLSLADITLMPIAAYLLMTDEGRQAFAKSKRLARWWLAVSRRPSLARAWPRLDGSVR